MAQMQFKKIGKNVTICPLAKIVFPVPQAPLTRRLLPSGNPPSINLSKPLIPVLTLFI